MAKKVPITREPNLPGAGEGVLGGLESKPGRVLSSKPSLVSPRTPRKKERIQEEDKEKSKEAKLYAYRESVYNEQLNLALKQQKEGNCEASIKTNEELLKASPPPPDSIKEKAYLSLAECYEQKGDWYKAISSYNNLQEIAPKQTAFAKDRIEALKQKINLLKARELRLGNTPEEGQLSE
jgi:tetratricopeptide (TPR) repeat protein